MLLNCGVGEDSRVPWTARRSNQSILKEISPEYSLEGLMLKLKLQYFGYHMGTADSLEKTLMLGKIEGGRRRGWQRMGWLDDITTSKNMSLSKLWELVMGKEAWHAIVRKITESYMTEWLNWTELFLDKWAFPGGTSGKESPWKCRRHKRPGFDPQIGKISWRKAWQPTPVCLPRDSHGQRSLVGYSPQGQRELDLPEVT